MPSLIESKIFRYSKITEKIAAIKNSQRNLGIRSQNNSTSRINSRIIGLEALINT